jgi:hypothetical protein
MRIILFILIALSLFLAGCANQSGETGNSAGSSMAGTGSESSSKPEDNSVTGNAKSGKDNDPDERKDKNGPGIETAYTDLAENKCKTVDLNEQEEWSVQSCKGVEGYSLIVSEGDLRQTIDVVSPDGKKHKLDMWTVVSSGFSTVGDKAEWRLKKDGAKRVPVALIVRYNVNEDSEDTEKIRSYLTVSKISSDGICITDIVKPIKNANQKARELADKSAGKPCLKK